MTGGPRTPKVKEGGIKKATECKDKHGRILKIGDEIIVRGKITDMPMDLEEDGKAIVKVTWLGAIPLSNLVESKELEKSIAKLVKKPARRG
jgi:hypothetical protein